MNAKKKRQKMKKRDEIKEGKKKKFFNYKSSQFFCLHEILSQNFQHKDHIK